MRRDKSRGRIFFVSFIFFSLYLALVGKLIYLGLFPDPSSLTRRETSDSVSASRPDILDREGRILGADVKTISIFAEPRRILDKDEAVELLTAILPDVNARDLRQRLSSHRGFTWVKRGVTPQEQEEIFRLGLPGIGFLPENKRIYPNGPLAAHVLGFTNIDNFGTAGIEKYIDSQGLLDLNDFGFRITPEDLRPVVLSLDLKATQAIRDELEKGLIKFKAKAAAGALLDVNTGEVIALASLPDYDPNNPVDALDVTRINRLTVGVYEMGSTFKALTLAMALEAGRVNLNTRIDARENLHYGRFTIHDFHAQHRILSLPEVFTYSSNIGTARIALMMGVEAHKSFLKKTGQLDRLYTELPENAEPLVPKRWGELNTMTIAFGHGLAVAPLQALMAVGALVNGGYLITPTFLKRTEEAAKKDAPRIIKAQTSEAMRYLMRLNAEVGSAKTSDIKGYFVGGKTGTADKVIDGRYAKDRVFTTFTAVFPSDKPKYVLLTVLDEPQALPETHGYRTAAWNAGVVAGKIIERVGPLLNMPPRFEIPNQPFPLLAKMGYGFVNQPAKEGSSH